MKPKDRSDNISGLFADVYKVDPTQQDAGTPAKRREAERKHRLAHYDGRRKRATGRTKQCNLKMNPEQHAWLVNVSRDRGVRMVVIVEEALALWKAANEKKVARA